jgi:hypothetical protein
MRLSAQACNNPFRGAYFSSRNLPFAGRRDTLNLNTAIVRVHSNIVGRGVMGKPDGLNVLVTLQERLADTVHTVHDAPVTRKDDRIRQIAIENKACMLYDLAAR